MDGEKSSKFITWREPLLLIFLVFLAHYFRMEALSVRGEEPRRALIAAEMVRTGEWFVPQVQGVPQFSRPPLQYWCIAFFGSLHGAYDAWAARIVSVLATLLTTFVVFFYSRLFLSRFGAFAAAAVFATMGQILKLGRLAETELLFTLFVSSSLFLWHWGYHRKWASWKMWSLGYAVAALATLTKGSQAPVYFVAITTVFCFLARDFRRWFSWGHLAGIMVFAGVLGIWMFPFYLKMDLIGIQRIFFNEGAGRFNYADIYPVIKHLVSFPLAVLGCMAPWSLLLVGFLHPSFRKSIGQAGPMVFFLTACIAVSFPSCWLAPQARCRYYLPLYPCFAPLIALVIQRCCEFSWETPLSKTWRYYLGFCIALFVGLVLVAVLGGPLESLTGLPLAQPPVAAAGYAFAIGALLLVVIRVGFRQERANHFLVVFSLGICLALFNSIWMVNLLVHSTLDHEKPIAAAKKQIPNPERLVSFGPAIYLFLFYYNEPVQPIPWPKRVSDFPENATHFCFVKSTRTPKIPFPWEPVAEINCDRTARPNPHAVMVIGKRLPAGHAKRR